MTGAEAVTEFMSGLIAMGYVVAGVFFLKFFWKTHDSLFAVFAAAFLLLAMEQGVLTWAQVPREEQSWVYLLRLTAFILIIVAILLKNRQARRI